VRNAKKEGVVRLAVSKARKRSTRFRIIFNLSAITMTSTKGEKIDPCTYHTKY